MQNEAKEKYSVILLDVIKREFKRISERKTLFSLYMIFPIILFVFFAMIYMNEMVIDIPVAIYDEDSSELSILLTRYVESTSSMKIVTYVNSLEEVKSEFKKGNIDGAFYFPKDTEKNIKSGKQANIVSVHQLNQPDN